MLLLLFSDATAVVADEPSGRYRRIDFAKLRRRIKEEQAEERLEELTQLEAALKRLPSSENRAAIELRLGALFDLFAPDQVETIKTSAIRAANLERLQKQQRQFAADDEDAALLLLS